MNLWITIDIDGACVWHKEPGIWGDYYEGELGEYIDVDTDEAKELCGFPELPYIGKINIDVIK